MARLHLICDILHNSASSVPSAWKFRQEFQSRLGIVFDHLSNIYHSFPGKLTAETFKKQITTVLDIWDDWIVFSGDFIAEMRSRLDGNVEKAAGDSEKVSDATIPIRAETAAAKFKVSSFQAAAPLDSVVQEDVDGQPMDEVDGEPLEDLDGEPMPVGGEDLDGEAMDDLDGAPMDDLDGAPIADVDAEPLDGVPMDEGDSDLDGAPL